jgi:hypothetical protein
MRNQSVHSICLNELKGQQPVYAAHFVEDIRVACDVFLYAPSFSIEPESEPTASSKHQVARSPFVLACLRFSDLSLCRQLLPHYSRHLSTSFMAVERRQVLLHNIAVAQHYIVVLPYGVLLCTCSTCLSSVCSSG